MPKAKKHESESDPKKSKKAPPPEPIPICLNRKQWDEVVKAMKRSNATGQQMNHIRTWLNQAGDMVVIDIEPSGAKWIGSEVLRGTALGVEVLRQYWFWTKTDLSIFDGPEYVFVINAPFEEKT